MQFRFGKGRKGSGEGSGSGSGAVMGGGRFAGLSETRAYWEGLRAGEPGPGALPRREQIDPRGLSGVLSRTVLVERVAPGHARFRIAGMEINDLMGLDVRGMPLSTLFMPEARARLSEGLETLFSAPAILEYWLEAERGLGKPQLEARLLLLPVVSRQGEVEQALGCLALNGEIGRAPRRFAITALLREPIAREDRRKRSAVTMAEFAEDQAAFAPMEAMEPMEPLQPIRPPRGKPQLRLVVDNAQKA